MSESQNENPQTQDGENKTQTPAKRTPSKRRSMIEKAQRESEELIKNMGGSLDVDGGRRTRSSTRGITQSSPITPPPAKKSRTPTTTPSRRGRHKKSDVENEEDRKSNTENVPTTKKNKHIEKEETLKLENCKIESETINTDVSKGKNKETEVDAKLSNSIEKEMLESISEETPHQLPQDKKDIIEPQKEITDEKLEMEVEKSQKSSEITTVSELEKQQSDESAPMEVDGFSSDSAVQVKSTPLTTKTTEIPKSPKSATKNECSEEKNFQVTKENNLSATVDKTDLPVNIAEGNDAVNVTTTTPINIANEKETQKQDGATKDVCESLVTEKQPISEYLSDHKKEGNNKTESVCESKVTTVSGDVAAQPCN